MTAATKTKTKVLKDFSDLQPIEKRIELLAIGIYQIAFRGECNEDFRPRKGTQVERVWKMVKLDERQQISWITFFDHVTTAVGKSGAITGGYGDFHDKSHDGFKVPSAFTNRSYRELERLWAFLSRKERALLTELLQDSLRSTGLQLETIGLVRSGYRERDAARAAGVVHVQTLLDRLGDFFQI